MDAAEKLWWRKVLVGPNGSIVSDGADGSSERYAALPRASDPRVFVDLDCPKAMDDAIDRMVSSRTTNSTIRGLASPVSSLVGRRKADWLASSDDEMGTLREHLSDILGRPVKLWVSVGPPRPNRKPVVRCYAGNEMVAFAKLGPDAHTKAMVENEASWLKRFMTEPLEEVVTPELIYAGSYGETALILMSPLDLVDDLGVSIGEMPKETLAQFLQERTESGLSVRDTPWWKDLAERLGDEKGESVASAVSRITDDSLFDALEISAWHGDWSPWNTGTTRSGKLAIWDWERAAEGVPAGLDLLHLHYQYGVGLSGATLDLASLGIPTSHHRRLHVLYLLELCARHTEADALKTPRHRRVLDALDGVLNDWA